MRTEEIYNATCVYCNTFIIPDINPKNGQPIYTNKCGCDSPLLIIHRPMRDVTEMHDNPKPDSGAEREEMRIHLTVEEILDELKVK